MTEMVSNNAVAVVLAPIVIQIAAAIDVSPVPFLVAVMFGASASFATPIGYQTNTYVFGAGGYHFKDFVKIGVPLNLLLWIVCSALIPLLWPF
jgi:di/tricarboxylate transporter